MKDHPERPHVKALENPAPDPLDPPGSRERSPADPQGPARGAPAHPGQLQLSLRKSLSYQDSQIGRNKSSQEFCQADRVCVDTGISALKTLERGENPRQVHFWDMSVAEPRNLGDRVRMFFPVNMESTWSRDTQCCFQESTEGRREWSRQSLWDPQLCQYGVADPRGAQGWLLSLHCDSHILF